MKEPIDNLETTVETEIEDGSIATSNIMSVEIRDGVLHLTIFDYQ